MSTLALTPPKRTDVGRFQYAVQQVLSTTRSLTKTGVREFMRTATSEERRLSHDLVRHKRSFRGIKP